MSALCAAAQREMNSIVQQADQQLSCNNCRQTGPLCGHPVSLKAKCEGRASLDQQVRIIGRPALFDEIDLVVAADARYAASHRPPRGAPTYTGYACSRSWTAHSGIGTV
jgi:hypothetical protein